jgi:hypothetical protein
MINYGGAQGQYSVVQAVNTQAFWLADAGVQKARTLVSSYVGTTGYPQCINNPLGTTCVNNLTDTNITGYSATITLPPNKPWSVTATGTPTTRITRTLYAQIGYQGLTNAISTTGTVTINGANNNQQPVNGSIAQGVSAVNFSTIFGITLAQAQTIATNSSTFYDCTVQPNNCTSNGSLGNAHGNNSSVVIPSGIINKLIYVKLNSTQTLTLNGGWSGSNFLIVNGGTVDMSGSGNTPVSFTGIIWVENGSFSSIGGGVNINGSIYINGNASINTSINGASVDITFDQNQVNTVETSYGSSSQHPSVVCWSEVSC